ncbi:MAG TPA: alcohol dehydrogenase catalytic domain-containing protein [Gemmatimonadales bacterium]|nr:alcohol dehydrogenase catalytic domain-containing protein [Gemmatimonadales bacterium]
MRAIRYHGPRQPLRLESVPKPAPRPGEVLVRVTAAGICHTELHFLSGLLDLGVHPLTLGHEVVGVVEETGAGVEGPKAGDRVILYYYVGCGRCAYCLVGEENLCDALVAEYGFVSDGGFAEYAVAPARNAVPLPPEVSDEAAAPIGCGVTTAVHAAALARLAAGDVVLVYGVGAVAFGLIQLARLSGAEVIAVSRTPAKLEKARALGAAHLLNGNEGKIAERVREITRGHGADVVFELVATKETMAASTAALAKRGRLVFVGYSEDSYTVHPIQLVITEASVTGSVGNTLGELVRAVDLVAAGKMVTVVDRTLPLGEFQKGIDALAKGQLVGRAVLRP